jgi:hypothetical protein
MYLKHAFESPGGLRKLTELFRKSKNKRHIIRTSVFRFHPHFRVSTLPNLFKVVIRFEGLQAQVALESSRQREG